MVKPERFGMTSFANSGGIYRVIGNGLHKCPVCLRYQRWDELGDTESEWWIKCENVRCMADAFIAMPSDGNKLTIRADHPILESQGIGLLFVEGEEAEEVLEAIIDDRFMELDKGNIREMKKLLMCDGGI